MLEYLYKMVKGMDILSTGHLPGLAPGRLPSSTRDARESRDMCTLEEVHVTLIHVTVYTLIPSEEIVSKWSLNPGHPFPWMDNGWNDFMDDLSAPGRNETNCGLGHSTSGSSSRESSTRIRYVPGSGHTSMSRSGVRDGMGIGARPRWSGVRTDQGLRNMSASFKTMQKILFSDR